MPYIDPEKRKEFESILDQLDNISIRTGDMNYFISSVLHRWIRKYKLCYDMLNSIVGVLECIKLELYRMIAAPYEDQKKEEKCPVSGLDKKDE